MNTYYRLILPCLFAASAAAGPAEPLKLWYDAPAREWVEALPIGNGRIGAMIFGEPACERVQLNELTVWAGSPFRNDNPNALEALPVVRRLIFEGKLAEARDLAERTFTAEKAQGMPYQPAGNLTLTFPGHAAYTDYHRELRLDRAVAAATYRVNGIRFTREYFASFADTVIVVRLTADAPGAITFTAAMDNAAGVRGVSDGRDRIIEGGITRDHEGVPGKVRYEGIAKIRVFGGRIDAGDSAVAVTGADSAVVYIAAATNFVNYRDISGNAHARAAALIDAASAKAYGKAFEAHAAAYGKYFDRVHLDLGVTDAAKYPTDLRIEKFSQADDPQLVSLYFQFGRYLLISCSQPGGQPATLQGMWNDQLKPAWDSKYTININTEMNYWPSEPTNLSEMNEPLIAMVKDLAETGRATARVMYGAGGWVAHHNTDIWRSTGVVDRVNSGLWPMGGAWLSQHLWEKYAYNGDTSYLRSVYPVLKGACEFFLSTLVEEPEHRWLVVCPSMSPENSPAGHDKISLSAGCTMDNQIVFDLLTRTARAADVLRVDGAFAGRLRGAAQRLPPMQIGRHGQLQEWLHDWDDPGDKHRHVSHLYGVFPSDQISPFRTPELFDAARTSLLFRGDASTGWSMGWKVNLWARFQDGNHALKLITDQLRLLRKNEFSADGKMKQGGGTYPNMFDAHPPFQIDGNFGCTSGIVEMLLQSHDGAIAVLPALPEKWRNGSIDGLRARGGFDVAVRWLQGKAASVRITSHLGGNCRIRVPNELRGEGAAVITRATGKNPNPFYDVPEIQAPLIAPGVRSAGPLPSPGFAYDMDTEAGKTYTVFGVE